MQSGDQADHAVIRLLGVDASEGCRSLHRSALMPAGTWLRKGSTLDSARRRQQQITDRLVGFVRYLH